MSPPANMPMARNARTSAGEPPGEKKPLGLLVMVVLLALALALVLVGEVSVVAELLAVVDIVESVNWMGVESEGHMTGEYCLGAFSYDHLVY